MTVDDSITQATLDKWETDGGSSRPAHLSHAPNREQSAPEDEPYFKRHRQLFGLVLIVIGAVLITVPLGFSQSFAVASSYVIGGGLIFLVGLLLVLPGIFKKNGRTASASGIVTAYVNSDEALSLLRRVASGQAVPRMKNFCLPRFDPTMELIVDGWNVVVFTDETRCRHIDSLASPDGRTGTFDDWRSDVEFSQQPEDRLCREDSTAGNRMFQAFRRARKQIDMRPDERSAAPIAGR
jgi:hypothetical protein